MPLTLPHEACDFINSKTQHKPSLGLILGSGLGALADKITDACYIDYTDLPGFPHASVSGHSGKLVIGNLNGTAVACLQGRVHRYESGQTEKIKNMIRTLKLLGCENLLVTNAAGSLRDDVAPGDLMLIVDHINFSFDNPLIGPNDAEFGERFVALEEAYNPSLRDLMLTNAKHLNIRLEQGVYIGVSGPSFETPAEIRAFKMLGADLVGMSTVPDVIIARHCGLNVVAVSSITNYAAGMNPTKLSHTETLEKAQLAIPNLEKLIIAFAGCLRDE